MFDGLYFSRLRFHLQLERPHEFRGPLGRMLHGVLGNGLRRVVCPCDDGVKCGRCPTSADCAYSYIFKSPPPAGSRLRYENPNHPHPYIIEPPQEGTGSGAGLHRPGPPSPSPSPFKGEGTEGRGSDLSFDVVLVGRATEYLHLVVLALGRVRLAGVRARLATVEDSAAAEPRTVFTPARGFVAPPSRLTFEEVRRGCPDGGTDRLTIRFVQPALIQSRDRMVRRMLSFEVLLRALVRRLTWLGEYHCGIDPRFDKDEFYASAERVGIESSGLHWVQEQGNRHQPADGLLGEVRYAGPLGEYLPIVKLGEYLHVGKGTSIGLGRYEVVQATGDK